MSKLFVFKNPIHSIILKNQLLDETLTKLGTLNVGVKFFYLVSG